MGWLVTMAFLAGSLNAFLRNVVAFPEVPRVTDKYPSSTTPAPTAALFWSPAPMQRGVPGAKPDSSATALEITPTSSPDGFGIGSRAGSISNIERSSSSHVSSNGLQRP